LSFYRSNKIVFFLIIILVFNCLTSGFMDSCRVEAGFFSEHQDSILTVIKGLVMFWILNLMTRNATDNGQDDLITSTIKKSLSLDNEKDHNSEIIISTGESNMVELINNTRSKEGLKQLTVDLKLVEVARKKALDMINNDYFEHQSPNYGTPFDMLKSAGIDYSLAGENLAEAHSVEEAFELLLESPEHRDNILKSRYDKIGVGVVEGGGCGLTIVQLFIDSPDPTV
jgi:uncharacterized YkwD family protein